MLIICMAILLTACSKVPSDKIVRQDVEKELYNIVPETKTIDSIKIIEHNSNESTLDDVVKVKVDFNNGAVAYSRYYMVSYYYGTNKEWIFDVMYETDAEQWEEKTLKGISEASMYQVQ